jgi:SpoIID/LytB domain protein
VWDTTRSQVYGGVSAEDPRANAAADATAGQIRTYQGKPAFTQFCSSNGGWTSAGSVPYLAHTEDPYDDVSTNANHDWTTKLSAATIRSAYPGIGKLVRVRVTQREGGGDWQGRVEKLVLVGANGSRSLTGDEFRSRFGLKSTWFRL